MSVSALLSIVSEGSTIVTLAVSRPVSAGVGSLLTSVAVNPAVLTEFATALVARIVTVIVAVSPGARSPKNVVMSVHVSELAVVEFGAGVARHVVHVGIDERVAHGNRR